jgi:hypothetical protein
MVHVKLSPSMNRQFLLVAKKTQGKRTDESGDDKVDLGAKLDIGARFEDAALLVKKAGTISAGP